MENPNEINVPVASPRGDDDSGAAAVPPRGKGGAVAAEASGMEAVVPPGDSGVVGSDGEKKKGEAEEVGGDGVSGDGGGVGGSGDGGGVGGSGSGDGVGSDGGSGGGGGGEIPTVEMKEEETEETVAEPVMVETAVQGIPVEEIPVVETPVMEIPVVETSVRRSGEPKGKGIAMVEPVVTQGPVISSLDYAESATQEDVLDRARENPTVLDAVLAMLREAREAEMAQVWTAVEGERECESWAQEFKEEEEAEVQA